MQNLLLIGAGQLGSRYLQGIAKQKSSYNIIVVDPSEFSLNLSKNRWNESDGNQSLHEISWNKTMPKDIDKYDLAIVATSARHRASIIANVATIANVSYWVLEKILAQSIQELNMIKSSTYNSKDIFVNIPRRQMKWHQKIRSKILKGPLCVKKTGGLWGLACNAIHFIDLVVWWTGESLLSIETELLHKNWFESKRKGFFEVKGELIVKFSGGSELVLQSSPDILDDVLMIKFSNKDFCIINENKGQATFSNGNILNGNLELQSEMTGSMIEKILTKGDCELPTLKESLKQHEVFLEAMLKHWNRSNNRNDKLVPIT